MGVHDEIRKQATYETTDGEDSCDDRKHKFRHRYACGQAIVNEVGRFVFACEHGLYLVESGDMITILRLKSQFKKSKKKRGIR
jgi:hypothetical protein